MKAAADGEHRRLIDASRPTGALIDFLEENEVGSGLANQCDDTLKVIDALRVLPRMDVVHEHANGVRGLNARRGARSGGASATDDEKDGERNRAKGPSHALNLDGPGTARSVVLRYRDAVKRAAPDARVRLGVGQVPSRFQCFRSTGHSR